MQIKTEILQKMVSKSIQAASMNKNIPLTSLIGLEVNGKDLTLITTDGSNQLRVTQEIEYDPVYGPQKFYTIVNADTFAKLVGKTTKEFITLENKENYLEVVGNGTYKLEISINEEGEMVKFPTIVEHLPKEAIKIKLNDLQEAIRVAKASVAKTIEVPFLTGYYLSKNTITTDREIVCNIENQLMEVPVLIPSEIAELLLLVDGDKELNFVMENNTILFYNNNYIITGKELEGKENYPVQAVENLLKNEYTNTMKVNKQELLNILDRMSLFVTNYDKGGIYLKFDTEGLAIQSQKSNAIETIVLPEDRPTFNCLVDIEMLKAQIETISTDEVIIEYGQEASIKIVDGNVTHIISLLEKE